MERRGRGAWVKDGRGGTLNAWGTGPGPYYLLASGKKWPIGLSAVCLRDQGLPIERDEQAVFHGVVAIQVLTAKYVSDPVIDGIFNVATDNAVRAAQARLGLVEDGVVGSKTMQALLLPVIERTAHRTGVPIAAIYGILANEGGWDPGAVGWIDPSDVGLAQINLTYHPSVTMSDAFCPSFAVNFIALYLANAEKQLGDPRLAVASYNLGIGGTRQWVEAGSPDVWSPPWAEGERNVKAYIDRILGAFAAR